MEARKEKRTLVDPIEEEHLHQELADDLRQIGQKGGMSGGWRAYGDPGSMLSGIIIVNV